MKTDTRNLMLRMLTDTGFFFRRNLGPLAILSFLALLLYMVLIYFLLSSETKGQDNMGMFMIVLLMVLAIQVLHHGAEIRLFGDALEGRAWSLSRCVQAGFKSLTRLMPAYFLASLITLFGFLTFILPGVYLAARFAFYGFYIVLEGAEPVSALKASLTATRPYVLPLIGGIVLIGCPFVILASQIDPPQQGSDMVWAFLGLGIIINFIFTTLISIFKFRFYCLSKEEMGAPFPDVTPD